MSSDPRSIPPLPKRIQSHVQKKTMGGLRELLPLLITILVMGFIIGYADSFVHPFLRLLPWEIPFIGNLAVTGIGLFVMGILFYLFGLLASWHLGRKGIDGASRLLNSTPMVGTVYGLTQTVAGVMSSQYRFSRVVFIEWPRENMIALGFVTGRVEDPSGIKSLVIVYVPTVPNPTSGNMAVVVEDDVMETDITVEDAMRMVFSGGIVVPESMALARLPRDPEENEFIGRFTAAN